MTLPLRMKGSHAGIIHLFIQQIRVVNPLCVRRCAVSQTRFRDGETCLWLFRGRIGIFLLFY